MPEQRPRTGGAIATPPRSLNVASLWAGARPALLPAVMVLTLAYQLAGWVPLALVGHGLLALYIVTEWPRLTRIPRLILSVAGGVLVTLPWFAPDPAASLFLAFNRAAWFATFLAALSFLREAAATSPLVRRCGEVIINQPPAKRYLTLASGSYLIGMLLNMAVLNLLGVMVRRANTLAAAGGHAVIRDVRTRRMFTAMIRGFATAPLGSPLTLTLALILSILPELRWWAVLPWGIVTMTMLIAFGWLWDRATAPRQLASMVGPLARPPHGARTILRFLALVLAVFAAAVAVELALDVPLPLAILLTAPPAAFLWMLVQRRRHGPRRAAALTAARLVRGAPDQFGGMRAEVVVLCGAGLMGTLIAGAVPATAFADLLALVGLHGTPVAVLVLVLMATLPQLGLNPILVATIALSSMAEPQLFGLAPELLALATMCGWTMAIGCAPVTTSILIASRMADVSPQTAGWSWNGWFTAAATVLLAGWILVLGYVVF